MLINFQKVLFFISFMLSLQNGMSQCVMCKAQAEAQFEEQGSSINTGIIFIMTVPYIILFIVFHKQIISFFKNWKEMK